MSANRFLISVSGPNNIPVFAMAAEKNKAAEVPLDPKAELSHLIGGNRSRALLARFGEALSLVRARTTTPHRSAVYSVWLEVDDPGAAAVLDEMKILHGAGALRRRAEDELRDLQVKLDADISRGRYDLSRVADWERTYRAQEYIDVYSAVSNLKDQLRCFEIVSAVYPQARSPE